MGTRPTTLPGVIALLRHSHEFSDNYDWVLAASESAAEALEALAPDQPAEGPSQAKDIYEQKVIDDIDQEISFAYGIEAAIEGLEVPNETVKAGIAQLQRTHIERLQRLGARVLRIEVDTGRAIY